MFTFTGDRPDRLATRRHQIPAKRALPRCTRVRQSFDVTTRSSTFSSRGWQGSDEILLVRHARMQVWNQR